MGTLLSEIDLNFSIIDESGNQSPVATPDTAATMAIEVAEAPLSGGSDAAFEAVLKMAEAQTTAKPPKAKRAAAAKPVTRAPQAPLIGAGGVKLGLHSRSGNTLSVTLPGAEGFEDWLVERLHGDWSAQSRS